MTRKRSAKKKREQKTIVKKTEKIIPKKHYDKKVYICLALVGAFLLVLFLNSYFNITYEVGINPVTESNDYNKKFLLSGPDPYYNMRTVSQTLENGYYPWGEVDHMLNYPVGSNGAARPPLMNVMAVGFSHVLSPFMSEDDAIGYSMQFLPALFGALLVIPIYFIGKSLFNYKVGIISALLIPLVPIHIASGHGTAYSLFDHDSLVLLLSVMIWLFFIKGLKSKDKKEALIHGTLLGVSLGALSLTWISAQFIYIIIVICFLIQIIVNIFRKEIDINLSIATFTGLLVAYLMYLPLSQTRFVEFTLLVLVGIVSLGIFSLKKFKIPYIISLPILALFSVGGLGFLYFFKEFLLKTSFSALTGLAYMSELLFGVGVYGTKTDLTIAEAKTFNISRTVMSFGPALYWLALAGLLIILIMWWRDKKRTDLLFFATLYIIEIQILGTAGRFINDLIPLVVVLGGFIIWSIIERMDIKSLIRSIKTIRSFGEIPKKVKIVPVLSILLLVGLVLVPNTYMSFDAAIPMQQHQKYFGEDSQSYHGLALYKETYWVEALTWLSEQDTEIPNPEDRPGFISWWDYGFYCSAVGEHPTVADNFQEGIPTAAAFQTSANEMESTSVLIIRLLEGDINNHGSLSNGAKSVIETYLKENTTLFCEYMENPENCPSNGKLIGEEYGNDILRIRPENAKYQDCVSLITNDLDDEDITQFYLDVEEETGYSIRYYGVEGYDMNIFSVFAFLADRGVHGYSTFEDDYQITLYEDNTGMKWRDEDIGEMTPEEQDERRPFNPVTEWKEEFYSTMVNKVYKEVCGGMKHWRVQYISAFAYPGTQYAAVIIAQYYPGCFINGTVSVKGVPLSGIMVGLYDDYGILHGMDITNNNGTYELISVAGDNKIACIIDGSHIISQESVTITQDEANRISNFRKEIDLEIETGNLTGTVYNSTELYNLTLSSKSFTMGTQSVELENKSFYIADMIPGNYIFSVWNNTNQLIHEYEFFVNPGENVWNTTILTDGIE